MDSHGTRAPARTRLSHPGPGGQPHLHLLPRVAVLGARIDFAMPGRPIRSLVTEDRSAAGRPRPDGTEGRCRAAFAACQRCGGHRGRTSPYDQAGSQRHDRLPGQPDRPCHYRAIHKSPERSRADNHGQRQRGLDQRRSPSSQVTAEPDLALGAGGRRFKSGRPDHQHEPPAQQGCRRPLTRLTKAGCP
jgi:hypothetical protein